MLVSIVFFAFLAYVTGLATVQLATGRYRLSFETHVMCTGVGLGAFGVVTVALLLLHVPLTWVNYLIVACGLFVLASLRDILSRKVSKLARASEPFWSQDARYLVAAMALAAVLFVVFLHGTFAVPWLAVTTPLQYAIGAKHVALEHDASAPPDVRDRVAGFLSPFPPAYPALMGVLHQSQQALARPGALPPGSIYWTLKFFNVLLVSLSVVYFFMMAKQWTSKPALALWMTGVIWALPCFMSHFIQAQSLGLTLFFPAFWALERSRGEPRWCIVAAVVVAGLCLADPAAAAVFILMALLYGLANLVFSLRKVEGAPTLRETMFRGAAVAAGVLASLAFYVPACMRFGWSDFLTGLTRLPPEYIGPKLSGAGRGLHYGLGDFLGTPLSPPMSQPTGLGVAIFLLLLAGLVLWFVRRSETWASRLRVTALAWLALALLGTLAEYLPVALYPYRFWAILAVPVAMIAGDFLAFLAASLGGRRALLAVAAGAGVGAAAALFGLGEIIFGAAPVPLTGARLLAAVLFGLVGLAGIVLSLHALVQPAVDGRVRGIFAALAVVVAGVALTDGFAKARFEGFSEWDPGRGFYQPMVSGDAVRKDPDAAALVRSLGSYAQTATGDFVLLNDLMGYVTLRRELNPNTPVLGLTCGDDRIIGFDLFTPPMDESLARFRRELEGLTIEQLNEDVVKRIHEEASRRHFTLVTVDHRWAVAGQWMRMVAEEGFRRAAAWSRIDPRRLQDLLDGRLPPAPLEERALALIRAAPERRKAGASLEEDAALRVRRLGELLEKTPADSDRKLFTKKYDSGPSGIALYAVNPLANEKEE